MPVKIKAMIDFNNKTTTLQSGLLRVIQIWLAELSSCEVCCGLAHFSFYFSLLMMAFWWISLRKKPKKKQICFKSLRTHNFLEFQISQISELNVWVSRTWLTCHFLQLLGILTKAWSHGVASKEGRESWENSVMFPNVRDWNHKTVSSVWFALSKVLMFPSRFHNSKASCCCGYR